MTSRLLLLASCLLPFSTLHALEITQSGTGKTLEVTPVSFRGKNITFKQGGKTFSLPASSLTPESRQKIASWFIYERERNAEKYSAIQQAIGHELFNSRSSLWNEKAETVAKRLNWRPESYTGVLSFRSYPSPKYGFLNAHPYCCTLYADENNKVSHLSLVFANKGDYGSTVGFGQDHFQPQGDLPSPSNLNEAIARDAKCISTQLTAILGEPTEQRYGEKEDRRNALRWDFLDHAFILSERSHEYTHLLIVPSDIADNEGKQDFIKDQDLREMLSKNIARKDNGDTYLDNIPMVNQGPKGYCTPATFERAMRYMQVPADMYLLATIATAQGGGTNPARLADEAKRIIRSKARRIKDLDLRSELDMKLVQKYIDKGVPILWNMRSLSKYNEIANSRTKERESVKDFDVWATSIQEEAEKALPLLRDNSNHHTCMIIGYNAKTNEIAVSDSWGPRFALRWIHLDIATAVSGGGGFVIDL
ncbi:hypothetical protein Rhal01_02768 [Rubritalea halochordaticola]|uniref:Peptidase C39-like domain-containing protein n=1 Tax=Rubritalea halochordaticola TaxID=714537 RepID=A0ABP9V1M4_9BACT